ncbi:hypothetical protein EDF38_0045 [Frigoribacterium sp. PhB160]|uniref:O-antigen ligase family protein n=1 Tax=Frigoribacterium sp. PhB160 TaxID=2485192 RepID=UPI000F46D3B9|nr:O-antigen ligase family protein [Frigoribacterium sp. PhB160]ROS60969.1 hypothetical protein EDF38_0045 [Frigoribacterium sp. PhB160]
MGSGIALALGGLGVVLAMVLPKRYGLGIALVVFVVLPRFIYSENSIIQGIPPFGWVVAVWVLRTLGERTSDPENRRAKIRLVALLVVALAWFAATLTWSLNQLTSLGWIAPFVLGVVLVVVGSREADSVLVLRKVWIWTAAVLSLYGILEFLLGSNPIYDQLRQLLDSPLVRTWSVYRSNASFGHPLYAALFYSMSAAFAYGWAIVNGRRSYFVVAGLASLATVLTISRGGIAVLALALVAISTLAVFRQTRLNLGGKVGISFALIVAGLAAFQIPQLQERLFSAEALSSVAARQSINAIVLAAGDYFGYVGSGVGTSTAAALQFNPEGYLIENGYFQLFISAGIPGVALFAMILAVALVRTLRRGDLAGLGLVITFGIMLASFNGLESNPAILFLLGISLAHVFGPSPQATLELEEGLESDQAVAPSAHGRAARSATRGFKTPKNALGRS